ncbi:hypothetical protein DEU56DRAFT_983275 [Suillus clintonianus]|uniref:uncharacterized protein n=1 Tax=Suillus clintonianus TaxID=1904413 RepID=UPI001B87FDF1|nr:uncharacterized protein DEU56DRAFT_983275 [Suillus clintonianus]KAG2125365.1 hypothetical protein DEU56DRAFT_983275 [Suillus clintonianus]
MSFAGTPLGQGRRLDHHTFLNKTHLTTIHNNPSARTVVNPPTSPQRSNITTSYAYGAPTAGSKSPPKPTSSAATADAADDETALVRYARLKRERSLQQSQPTLNPETWSVKDTSVNIASAFSQAASTLHEMNPSNPNNAWASGSQTNLNVPRSTSVDYEKETHSTNSRRLAPPPNRLSQRNTRKPLSKQDSTMTHVSDSEGEDNQESQERDRSARGKSPFEQVVDVSKRALTSATSFYMRPRSTEPGDISAVNTTTNGRDSSYDYASEELEYQETMRQKIAREQQEQTASKRLVSTHKRNRMSMDNKAYQPSQSDIEGESDDVSDDGRKRKRKIKKKDLGGGPLTTLPVAGYDKRRKKKRGSKTNVDGEEEDDDSSSGSEQRSSAQRASTSQSSIARNSLPPPSRSSIHRGSVPPQSRGSVPPQSRDSVPPQSDDPTDLEVGLDSIPEMDEPPAVDGFSNTSDMPSRSFSVGGLLGLVVNRIVRLLVGLFAWAIRILALLALVLGRIFGSIIDIIFMRPAAFFSHINAGPFITLARYLFVAAALYAVWHQFHDPILQMLPIRSPQRTYYAPDTPITNLDELSARLQNIEAALSGLSLDQQRARAQQDLEARAHGDVVNRIFALEARIREEAKRVSDTEAHLTSSSSQSLVDLRREIQALHSQLSAVESAPRETVVSMPPPANDEEARAKLRILEERLGGVEGSVKDALEQAKNAAHAPVNVPAGTAWWSKLASTVGTGAGLTIKSTDGSDVTSLISQLVDNAIARYGTQDIISRPDFALHSGGARPIPHLTSGTLELRPSTLQGQILGLITGHGYEVGRSPITALHQDLHSGNCWPMTGSYGQLGVMLAFPAIVSDITIDHVAKEVAFDLSTAPKDMEVWGQVEGKDNLEKVAAWRAEQAARREAAKEAEEAISEADLEDDYPATLPMDVPFIRLASFTYDIHAHSNIQTFPVRQEVRDLSLDFGIVALVVKDNWGKDGYTCLYRFRVHGERPGGASLPFPVENS